MEESKQTLANLVARLKTELKEVRDRTYRRDEDDDDWENTLEAYETAKCDLERKIKVLTELINNFPSSYIGDGKSLTLGYLMADLKLDRVVAKKEEKITLSKEIETLQRILDIR